MSISRVFIVGCPRSGTTLVQSYLASHSNVISFPESHFFSNLKPAHWFERIVGFSSGKAYYKLEKLLEACNRLDILPSQKEFGRTQRKAVKSFIKCLDTIAYENNVQSWVEKTPIHLHYIQVIERYLNPYFIHVIRPGEDVVASMYEVTHSYPQKWGGERTLHQCISRWNKDILLTQNYKDYQNHLIVSYENFLEDHENEMRRITDFLGFGKWKKTANPRDKRSIDNLIRPDEDWKRNIKKPPKKTTRKFENKLTKLQQQDVQTFLKAERYKQLLKK